MNFENFIKKAVKALNESKVKYVIIGGIASIFYGRPRTTLDLDVVVLIKEEEIKDLCKSLKRNGFEVKEEEVLENLEKKTHVSIFFKDSAYRIDLKGIYSSLDKASILGRKRVKIFGENVWIERPEDVVIAKLVYGSKQDFEDAKAIILNQRLNKKYLFERAKKEKVLRKLKKLMAQ